MTDIHEIEHFDFPSDHLEEKDSFIFWLYQNYPWFPTLLVVVVVISVLHFVIF